MSEKDIGGRQPDGCVMAGCEEQDPVKETEGILAQLNFISRQIPYLLNLLAESNPEKAEDCRSSLITILQESQIEQYRISGTRIVENSCSK